MPSVKPDHRFEIYERDGGCLICGITYNLTIDHIVPVSKGASTF